MNPIGVDHNRLLGFQFQPNRAVYKFTPSISVILKSYSTSRFAFSKLTSLKLFHEGKFEPFSHFLPAEAEILSKKTEILSN